MIFVRVLLYMNRIYEYIPKDLVLDIHDYSQEPQIKIIQNTLFRTQKSNLLNFYTPIGVINNKIISITNKQLSYLPAVMNHYLGDTYSDALKDTYLNLINTGEYINIEEPVMQFIDYESISGTGHSYDLMFYLLFFYKMAGLKIKLLVVKSDNIYYNNTLKLIQKYFHVEYIFIETDKNYFIKELYCCQTYVNILFNNIKEFINNELIKPIMHKFDSMNSVFYNNIYKIKINDISNINRDNNCYNITDSFTNFCTNNNFHNIDGYDEDYKIYLLNKAKNIIVSWGSLYYINIDYYLSSTENKFISLLFHTSAPGELMYINYSDNYYYQNMPSDGMEYNNYYNYLKFNGEITFTNSLDEWLNKTKL